MQDLRVTLVQPNQIWEDPTANFDNYERHLKDVNTDLIVLPEMFQTCFSMNLELALPFENHPAIDWLKKLAVSKDAAIYTSLMVQDGEHYFNRGVFVTPQGLEATYDKRKTFGLAKENNYFSSGTKQTIVSYKNWNLNLQICYDLRFPEIARNKISNQEAQYDVLIYVANWPQKRSEHWKALLKARAIENQCFVVGVNRVGTDGMQFEYSGDSQLVDALGQEKLLEAGKEMTLTFVMKGGELKEIREKLPFLKDA